VGKAELHTNGSEETDKVITTFINSNPVVSRGITFEEQPCPQLISCRRYVAMIPLEHEPWFNKRRNMMYRQLRGEG
jgi:hypothetical protein